MKLFFLILLVVIIMAAFSGTWMSRVEQPEYNVIHSKDDIEIRDYKPMILAQVEVAGERRSAISEGFKVLAAYIFGKNISNEKMAMTAPVMQTKDRGVWKIRFVMSQKLEKESPPKPNSEEIKLIQEPLRRFAVIQFSGIADDATIKKHTEKLQTFLSGEKLSVIGEPILAFYNPPWTLPILRRNEVLIEIKADR